MGFCNFLAFLCCPRRYHINNVLKNKDRDEVTMLVDEFDALYLESSSLVDVSLEGY